MLAGACFKIAIQPDGFGHHAIRQGLAQMSPITRKTRSKNRHLDALTAISPGMPGLYAELFQQLASQPVLIHQLGGNARFWRRSLVLPRAGPRRGNRCGRVRKVRGSSREKEKKPTRRQESKPEAAGQTKGDASSSRVRCRHGSDHPEGANG